MQELEALDISEWLAGWQAGEREPADALFNGVYRHLLRIARGVLGARGEDRITPNSLIHEAYLRLHGNTELQFRDRGHFFATAARAMKFALIDAFRRRGLREAGQCDVADAGDTPDPAAQPDWRLVEALEQLDSQHPERCEVLVLKDFGGLTYHEVAKQLNIAPITARRRYDFARAFLKLRLAS